MAVSSGAAKCRNRALCDKSTKVVRRVDFNMKMSIGYWGIWEINANGKKRISYIFLQNVYIVKKSEITRSLIAKWSTSLESLQKTVYN